MALKLLVLLGCVNLIQYAKGEQGLAHKQERFLVGFVQQVMTNYIVEVNVPPQKDTGTLDVFVYGLGFGSEKPLMVADLTGERLCFAQASRLTCIERLDSGDVDNRDYGTPSHSRIVSINFPYPRTNDYEVIYTTKPKGNSMVSIMMFDSKSNSSVTIYRGDNIYEKNIAVDTNNWFVFFEDVNKDKMWYVDLLEGNKTRGIPNGIVKTTDGNHRNKTIAVDIRSGILYNMLQNSVFSWHYLNETVSKKNFDAHEHEYKSHLSLSTSGTMTYTRHLSGNFSLESRIVNPKEKWAHYYPKQNGTLMFGTEISWNQNKTNLDACSRFCRLKVTGNCICWCPSPDGKPLQTIEYDCKPLVVLAVDESGVKVLSTSSEPTEEWNWLKSLQYGQEVVAYNSLTDRLCEPKRNPEFNETGIRCYTKTNLNGSWVPNVNHISQNPENAPYLVNQAANTSDLFWMAEDVNETQSLWALENGIAKNMKVYVKDPLHVAIDSFRQILFWCSESEGKVQLRWQAFNRTGKKSNCFERQVSAASRCHGLAVSEVQAKVYILSQDAIYQATYEELQKEAEIQKNIFKFISKGPVKNIKGFAYHSGNLLWFNPSISSPTVNIFRLNDVNKSVKLRPIRVIGIDNSTSQIQVLVPHYETLKSKDPCHGFSVNFAGICPNHVLEGPNPPGTCTLDLDPLVETTTPPPTSTTMVSTTQAPITETISTSSPSTSLVTSTTVLKDTRTETSPTPTPESSTTSTTAPTTNATSITQQPPPSMNSTAEQEPVPAQTTTPTPVPTTAQANVTDSAPLSPTIDTTDASQDEQSPGEERPEEVTKTPVISETVPTTLATPAVTTTSPLTTTTTTTTAKTFTEAPALTTATTHKPPTEELTTTTTTTTTTKTFTEVSTPTPTTTPKPPTKAPTPTTTTTPEISTEAPTTTTKGTPATPPEPKTTTTTKPSSVTPESATTPPPVVPSEPPGDVPKASTDTPTTASTTSKPPEELPTDPITVAPESPEATPTIKPPPPPPKSPTSSDGSSDAASNPKTGTSTPDSGDTSTASTDIAAIILMILAIISIIIVVLVFHRYKQKKSQYANAISIFINGSESLLESARDTAERSLYIPFTLIISTNHVVIENFKRLREGAFSIACLGAHAGNDVVIETFKEGLDIATFNFLLHNLKLLVHIGQHNHVIEFFGAEISAIQTGVVRAVLEHSLQGPLTNTLEEMRRNLGSDNESGASNRQDAVPNLMSWSSQIAQGLQHLWTRNIVHGNLCAKNIRVTDNNIVKIAVFGHVQTQFAKPKSGTSIKTIDETNFRWAAPETLQRSEYSFKSDVWSYGVTMWEIFSFGLVPYGERAYDAAFVNEIALGELRLQKPQLMTEDIYNGILVPCWRTEASERSTVAQINESWQQRLDRIK